MSARRHTARQALVAVLSTSALAMLTGCFDDELSQKPPRAGKPVSFDSADSAIGAEVAIALDDAAKLVNQRVPATFAAAGNGEDLCEWILGVRVCAGTRFSLNARRGEMKISAPNNNTLRVSVPISFSGEGGFRGTGCEILKCNSKNFNGALNANIDLSPDLDKDWCPKLNANISYSWTSSPRVEIVGGVWVDVTGQVTSKVNDKLAEIREQAASALDCAKVKPAIQKFYAAQTFPLQVPDGKPLHVNFKPSGIGYSGLRVDGQSMSISALVNGKLDIAPEATPVVQLPLPALVRIPSTAPQLSLAVAAGTPYESLSSAVRNALVGKKFEGDTPAGRAVVTVKKVEIYPSDDRLVVGLNIAADLPKRWLDVTGDVYLLAKPVVDSSTKVHLTDIAFARKLDNELWATATALFEQQIVDALTRVAVHDFSPQVAKAKQSLQDALDRQTGFPGSISLKEVSMGVGRIAIAEKELVVEGLFSAKASVVVKP